MPNKLTKTIPSGNFKPIKIQQPNLEHEGSEKKYDNGKLSQESIFKDINKDGKVDIHSVTNYSYIDGEKISRTFIDDDGDGYSDRIITKKYDKNGKNVVEEREIIEKNIKEETMEYQKTNRQMLNHYSRVYVI